MLEMLPGEDVGPSMPSVRWLGGRARPALQLASALDEVRRAPSILAAMRRRRNVLEVADSHVRHGVRAVDLLDPILEAVADELDSVAGLTAIHALARVPGSGVDAHLAQLLDDGAPGYREHAAWAARERRASPSLVEAMTVRLAGGGLAGMHAQAALAGWAASAPDLVLATLERQLHTESDEPARRYLTETIGLVDGRPARLTLEQIANDGREAGSVRETAVLAFAERGEPRLPSSIARLAADGGIVGRAVATVRAHHRLVRRGTARSHDRARGVRVAQVHLGAVLDERASVAGSGDAGGVATLLARLGARLADQPRVAEVLTIGRAADLGPARPTPTSATHRFESVRLAPGDGGSFTATWPSLVAAQRGIRSALLARGAPDVVHLRMADPGSLAAALVARELGIATVFTLAPDPHVHIATRERSGELDRAGFAAADEREALWFRVELVRHLAAQAREIALFPRADLRGDIEDLLGIDIASGPPRYTVVAEGVDTRLAETARDVIRAGGRPAVLRDLDAAIAALPEDRHGLPLAISVGRLHEVKGMARIVAAFAADERLSARANLVIVGGHLVAPSAAESAELARIEQELAHAPQLRDRVVLLGHRPNDDVALLLAATHAGDGDRVGALGAYVCGSRKEEFGLAIVEALAAGLPVVAPIVGGPASYVRPGVTGSLVDTASPSAIAAGVHAALDLAGHPGSAARARRLVHERFTIERMAQTLAGLYRMSVAARSLGVPVAQEDAA